MLQIFPDITEKIHKIEQSIDVEKLSKQLAEED